ncbi:MAG: FAD-binding oxidoreductase, partial [Gammaproteobacteria bacterium]|nr:FAD-binding oxidoreductase [Gammaproteobacteria bacterium]
MHHYTFRAVPGIVKRLTKIVGALVLVLTVATAVAVWIAGDDDFDYALPETTVNDVTRLNPTRVARVEAPRTVEELRRIVASSTGPISVGGGRYSQGGQISYTDSLHVDMRHLDDVVSLDVENRHITVQAGITWREIQEAIDAHDLAVKIMQTYANFTVGGSLSVNVHGRYIGEGPLVRSVESIGLVLANGELVHASREVNPQLFFGAIGGYGGLGIIVEAVLALESNTRIERRTRVLPVEDYARHFAAEIRDDPAVVFHNGDLYPPDYRTVREVSWYETQKPVTVEERLIPVDGDYDLQPRVIDFVAGSDFGKWARQHIIDPMLYRSERVVWRNYEASYDVAELEPDDRTETTYALREYFVPVGRFDAFVARMRDIFTRHDVNVINVSIRHALPDPGTLLAWADEEVFAFVVYYQQGTSLEDAAAVAEWSRELIDAAVELGGTYYLPYQVLATPEQFRAAYPRHDGFFALKAKVDPQNRFRNRLWQRHYPANREPFEKERGSIADYPRREEQTLLTIPEWYLVFNPVEYTDFLQVGNDPSDFPFFASIDEYWSLYDRVTAVADAYGYDTNAEYLTMLWVIGISTTAEYLVKGSYETTVGRLTRWLADGEDTPEDRFIAEAQRAYSE